MTHQPPNPVSSQTSLCASTHFEASSLVQDSGGWPGPASTMCFALLGSSGSFSATTSHVWRHLLLLTLPFLSHLQSNTASVAPVTTIAYSIDPVPTPSQCVDEPIDIQVLLRPSRPKTSTELTLLVTLRTQSLPLAMPIPVFHQNTHGTPHISDRLRSHPTY